VSESFEKGGDQSVEKFSFVGTDFYLCLLQVDSGKGGVTLAERNQTLF
jgi:hypothetical protein